MRDYSGLRFRITHYVDSYVREQMTTLEQTDKCAFFSRSVRKTRRIGAARDGRSRMGQIFALWALVIVLDRRLRPARVIIRGRRFGRGLRRLGGVLLRGLALAHVLFLALAGGHRGHSADGSTFDILPVRRRVPLLND